MKTLLIFALIGLSGCSQGYVCIKRVCDRTSVVTSLGQCAYHDPARHGPVQTVWPYVLGSHALVHGAFVYVATGSAACGMGETLVHALIDFGKCEKWYGIHTDQMLHIGCKLVWVLVVTSQT